MKSEDTKMVILIPLWRVIPNKLLSKMNTTAVKKLDTALLKFSSTHSFFKELLTSH